MHDYLRPGDHFLDVGANTGLHTLLASTRISSGRITCVEPDPKNLARLRRVIEMNHITNATILPVAASDVPGSATLDGQDVFARISPGSATASNQQTIEVARLDALLDDVDRIDFCKIDVEGAEWQALKGMTRLIERDALPVIAFEFNGNLDAYGHSEADFLSWVTDRGYSLATFHHDRHSLSFGQKFSASDFDLFALSRTGLEFVKQRMPEVVFR